MTKSKTVQLIKSDEQIQAECETEEYADKINRFCEENDIPFSAEPLGLSLTLHRLIRNVNMEFEVKW